MCFSFISSNRALKLNEPLQHRLHLSGLRSHTHTHTQPIRTCMGLCVWVCARWFAYDYTTIFVSRPHTRWQPTYNRARTRRPPRGALCPRIRCALCMASRVEWKSRKENQTLTHTHALTYSCPADRPHAAPEAAAEVGLARARSRRVGAPRSALDALNSRA